MYKRVRDVESMARSRQTDETERRWIRGYVMSKRRPSPDRQSDETEGAMAKRVRDVEATARSRQTER